MTGHTAGWKSILNTLHTHYGDRIQAATTNDHSYLHKESDSPDVAVGIYQDTEYLVTHPLEAWNAFKACVDDLPTCVKDFGQALIDEVTACVNAFGNEDIRTTTRRCGKVLLDLAATSTGIGAAGVASYKAIKFLRTAAAKSLSETAGALTNLGRGAARGPAFFNDFRAGQGFSGVYDDATGSLLLFPSTELDILPSGWVPRTGGHAVVNQRLTEAIGAPAGQRAGFTAFLEADGSLRVEWLSRSVNGVADPYVAESLRPGILDALSRVSGRTVTG